MVAAAIVQDGGINTAYTAANWWITAGFCRSTRGPKRMGS